MKSIDPLLNRKYDANKYHCVHFVIDAAKYLFGADYSKHFLGLTGTVNESLNASRHNFRQARRLDKPIDGCVVLMTNLMNESHVGLFYCQHVLHLSEQGALFQTLRTLDRHYSRFRFYEAKNISE